MFCILISPSSSTYELKAIFALMNQIRLSLLDGDKNNINYVFFFCFHLFGGTLFVFSQ